MKHQHIKHIASIIEKERRALTAIYTKPITVIDNGVDLKYCKSLQVMIAISSSFNDDQKTFLYLFIFLLLKKKNPILYQLVDIAVM